jgi:hypothetical protein
MATRTAKGKTVDFNVFMNQYGDRVAIGNAGLNARGDRVTRRGEIVTPVAQVMAEYNRSKANAAKAVPLSALTSEVFQSPAEALKNHNEQKKAAAAAAQAAQAAAPAQTPAPASAPKARKISESDE